MRIGMYIVMSLLLIAIVGIYVYSINGGAYSLELLGVNVQLPVAAWIAIAMGLVMLISVIHMMFYGVKGFFMRRKWTNAATEMQDTAYYSLLHEPKKRNFSVPEIRAGASLLGVSTLDASNAPKGLSSKLTETVAWINEIKDGKYVDLKSKKVHKIMGSNNPIVIQNNLNLIKQKPAFAETILTNSTKYDGSVVAASLKQMIDTESMYKLRKYSNRLDTTDLYTLLDRADNGEEIGLTVDNIKAITKNMSMKCRDYMRIANSAIGKISPDENLSMFKKFASKDEDAENAYLYTMFQYEMLDGVKSFLEENEEEKFKSYRLLYNLKKDNKNYKINEVINVDLVCNEH